LESGAKKMIPILEMKNITSELSKMGVPILNRLSFSLNPKDRLVLKGPSGSGKSLLLRSLIFLDPIRSGEVWFQNQKVKPEEIPNYRSRVIYLGQKPSLLEGSVEDNLKFAFQLKTHQNKKYDRKSVLKLVNSFNFEESFLTQSAKFLSGGESQIVALVRALILDPQILLLDEPTASLDASRSDIFEKLIVKWVEESEDRAFIWVTHHREQEEKVGTAFLSLETGNLK
jgi:putative ABC transport system ATP-binding protein